ncbi:zinc finger protein [Diaporthe sp. PMI_573]|nr:zinc finger protein [Diaporthaceae sp. PMI_573]
MADTGGAPPTEPAGDTASRSRGDGSRGRGRGDRARRGRGRGDGAGPNRGGNRGRGRGGNNQNAGRPEEQDDDQPKLTPAAKEALRGPAEPKPKAEGDDADADDNDDDVCFICANPIQHHSVAPCNHTTCHICSLRLRALYKNKDCAHCRTPAPFVIFTDDPSKRFEAYTDADITSADENIGIRYTNEDIVGDTVLLLRYNCPDLSCDFAGLGWPDLHRHVRSAHHNKMCDLCTRNKKVFTHEHELFTDKALHKHMAHGDDRPGDVAQTGFRGHPLCGFCGERFYDDDKLYEHCRNKHERCFICDRRDSRSPHYYQDYNALEKHFQKDHFLCLDRECLEKKFVVFESQMDLKAHQLSEHADSLSKDVRRDARTVDLSGFDLREQYQEERRGGGRSRGGREGRGRGRDPNADAPLPRSTAQPLRRDELAYQRQMAIHSAQSISNRTFGGQLTTAANTSGPTPAAARSQQRQNGASSSSSGQQPQPLADAMSTLSVTDQANMTPAERARLVRHGAVIERASNLLGNDTTKMNDFRAHISSYKNGSLTAPGLIDSFFSLFTDTSANALGTLVREVSDLFDDKTKADALHKAWQDWRAINEDYPSLPGLGGMHGATTSSSGWASAASSGPTLHLPGVGGATAAAARERHTTRVLKLKNSTQARRGSVPGAELASPPGSNASGPSNVQWSRPAAAAGSSSSSAAFPALPPAAGTKKSATAAKSTPLWIGGTQPAVTGSLSASGSRSGTSTPTVRRAAPSASGGRPPPREDAFPALPAAPKVQTTIFGYGGGRGVRRDFGGGRETGFSWGGGGAAGGEEAAGSGDGGEGGGEDSGAGGKKKGKGKKGKNVLVAWG